MTASPSITVAAHPDPLDALGEVIAERDALLVLTVAGLEFARDLASLLDQEPEDFDPFATCDHVDQFIDLMAKSFAEYPALRTPEWEGQLSGLRTMAAALRAEYVDQ